jgi:hypothetical protein
MLKELMIIEKMLPRILEEDCWNTVYVDYHKPYVKRVWKQIGENRLYLHEIFPCEKEESLLHPHPWPSAMKVISGTYEMGVGYSETSELPVIASTLILPENSYYEMTNLHSWHYVRPLEKSSLSLMITGIPWKRDVPKSDYTLRELTAEEKENILEKFKEKYWK